MSNKLNILSVVNGHLSTLYDSTNKKYQLSDLFTFYVLPFAASIIGIALCIDLPEKLIEILVSSSAIFTALLLNLLILVYDQKSKIPEVNTENPSWEKHQTQHTLIGELYYNISYATLVSLTILVFSVVHIGINESRSPAFYIQSLYIPSFDLSIWTTTPILIFLSFNLILTILMVIKRIYSLLIKS